MSRVPEYVVRSPSAPSVAADFLLRHEPDEEEEDDGKKDDDEDDNEGESYDYFCCGSDRRSWRIRSRFVLFGKS